MSQSLVKFITEEESRRDTATPASNGYKVGYGRASVDGAPMRYRGEKPPLIRDEEADNALARGSDSHCDVFDLSKPDDNVRFRKVLDLAAAGFATVTQTQFSSLITEITRPLDGGGIEKTQTVRHEVLVVWFEHYVLPKSDALDPPVGQSLIG